MHAFSLDHSITATSSETTATAAEERLDNGQLINQWLTNGVHKTQFFCCKRLPANLIHTVRCWSLFLLALIFCFIADLLWFFKRKDLEIVHPKKNTVIAPLPAHITVTSTTVTSFSLSLKWPLWRIRLYSSSLLCRSVERILYSGFWIELAIDFVFSSNISLLVATKILTMIDKI